MSDKVIIKGKEIPVLVAVTAEEQSKGLMYQKWPPPAMAFPYASAGIRKFWMKNTISPLDIVFCNAGKIVTIANGEPLNTMLVGPDSPCDLVVEFPKGTMNELGAKAGDELMFKPSLQTFAKELKNSSTRFRL